ncbi:cilia- and flagella-associated protein 184-like, partial [Centroberyx affinis]|uniref:cilia- and flagella-associated protein 184-like n=1 Tax=Centroberyx affinis TaxID=166261 RepID=UPI003A5BB172
MSADSSMDEGKSPVTDAGDEKDKVLAEKGASEPDQQNSDGAEASEGAPAGPSDTPEPGGDHADGNNFPTSEDLDAGEGPEVKPLIEQPLSREGSVVFEVNDNEDGLPRLDLETPERQTTSPVQEEEEEEEEEKEKEPEEEEAAAASPDGVDIDYEEYTQLLHQLHAQREKLGQHSSQLQMKLVEYLRRKTWDDGQPEKEMLVSDREQRYKKFMSVLADLKQQHAGHSEAAQREEEELRLQTEEKLGQVENEWRALVALKRDAAVTALSRCLGKPEAQAKAEAVLASEQHRQDELVQLRLEHIKLKIKVRKLEAEVRVKEEPADELQGLDFEKLQAEKKELNKMIEKRSEELFKLRKKKTGTMELLTNVKEKLQWSQTESQIKRAQLAEVEAEVARKRQELTRIKQARNGLHRDHLRLKQHSGLLGNTVLLRDFEDTLDASERLEETLGDLKSQRAETVLKCAGWKEKIEFSQPIEEQQSFTKIG